MNNELRIKKLPDTIRKNGSVYKLVERSDSKAIYRQDEYGWEVFKIILGRPHPKSESDTKNFDKVERFPCDEDFGKHAWTYRNFEEAQKRYASI